MLRSTFWRQLRVALMAGLVAGGLGALVAYERAAERPEFFCYDNLRHFAHHYLQAPAKEPVVMVSIDDGSIDDVRRNLDIDWPWPRSLVGHALEELKALGAKVVVLDSLHNDYSPYGVDDELAFVDSLQKAGNVVLAAETTELPQEGATLKGRWAIHLGDADSRREALAQALPLVARRLHVFLVPADKRFGLWLGGFTSRQNAEQKASSLAELGDLKLDHEPELRELTQQEMRALIDAEDWVLDRDGLQISGLEKLGVPVSDDLLLPRPEVAAAAMHVGFATDTARLLANEKGDFDRIDQDDLDIPRADVERSVRLFVRHGDRFFPSLPLSALLAATSPKAVKVEGGRLIYGDRSVALSRRGFMYISYPASADAFGADLTGSGKRTLIPIQSILRSADRRARSLSLDDKLQQAVQGKVVVVANVAASLHDMKTTPVPELTYGSAVVAAALRTLMLGDSLSRASRELDARWSLLMGLLGALYALIAFRYARSDSFLFFTAVGMAASMALYAGYCLHVLIDEHLWQAVFAPAGSFAVAALSTGWINFGETESDRSRIAEALGRFTSPAIVESVLRNPLLIAPKRRELTILFSDIAGFTGISETIPAPRLAELLSTYFTEMTVPIGQTQGHVDKFIGDAIMAFWNAPLASEKHAAQACKAALGMRDRLEKLKPALKKEYGVEVSARIGLNTGEVVVGELGSRGRGQEDKSNYTCVGDAVNLASRLEGVNKQYGTLILCGPRTVELAGEGFVFREIDRVRVKGKQEAVSIHELVAAKGERLGQELTTALQQYRLGLAEFRARDFKAAKERFELVLKVLPGDGPAAIFRDRCAEFIKSPPPKDWDGAHTLHDK